MTRPIPKPTPFDDAADAELARWPGVTWRREARAKHNALVLEFCGVSRFVVYPSTPSDGRRGALNHLADVRAMLREMGAERAEAAKPAPSRPKRPARRAPAVATVRPTERPVAGVGPLSDPFAALAAVRTKIVESVPVVMPIPAPRAWWNLRVGERA